MSKVRDVARVGGPYLRDVVLRPVAHHAGDVPAFPEAVSSEWLTSMLCADAPARVADWRYEPISRGSTCRGRYHIVYEGSGTEDLPSTVFSKSTATFRTRIQLGSTGALRAEMRFYRDVRPGVSLAAPAGYGGLSDRRSGRAILLIEDLARTRGVTFADNRSLHVDRTMASSLVGTLATLHGTFYDTPRFATDLRWLIRSFDLQRKLDALVEFERRMLIGLDRAGDTLPAAVHDRRSAIHGLFLASLADDDRARTTLVHTDVHLGNWFVDARGGLGLCDWAAIARGQGPRDLAYALMSALTVEERRAWERDLVAEYAARVSEIAQHDVPADAVWETYRRQTLHGLCFWLYTIGSGGLQPKTQDEEICRLNLSRMGQAVVDLESF